MSSREDEIFMLNVTLVEMGVKSAIGPRDVSLVGFRPCDHEPEPTQVGLRGPSQEGVLVLDALEITGGAPDAIHRYDEARKPGL